MSQLKYCQGTKCHEYKTKDRIRGPKGDKHYETRKQTHYFDSFCSQRCQYDWFNKFGDMAINHFGRIYEPKRTDANGAWYKSYNWDRQESNRTVYNHFFVNDLLGERRPITEQQYNDESFFSP